MLELLLPGFAGKFGRFRLRLVWFGLVHMRICHTHATPFLPSFLYHIISYSIYHMQKVTSPQRLSLSSVSTQHSPLQCSPLAVAERKREACEVAELEMMQKGPEATSTWHPTLCRVAPNPNSIQSDPIMSDDGWWMMDDGWMHHSFYSLLHNNILTTASYLHLISC